MIRTTPGETDQDQLFYSKPANLFERMVKTPEWQQAVEKNQWVEHYLPSTEFAKELRRQHGILKDVLSELGMVQ